MESISGDLAINNSHSFKFTTEELTPKSILRRFLSSSKNNFFNDPEIIILQFQEMEISPLREERLHLNLNIENFHLYNFYFKDQSQDSIIPRESFTLSREEFERILKRKSFLYLKPKFNLYKGDIIFDGERSQYARSFPPVNSNPISLEEIFTFEDSDEKEWFHRETPFGELMFIFMSKRELKREFFNIYKRNDFEIGRVNGNPFGSIRLHKGTAFLKVVSHQVMNHISKHGLNTMKCRPSNIITSQEPRVPTSLEISQSLDLSPKQIIKEKYSADSNEIWVKIDSNEQRNLVLFPANNSFFYEKKCDRKVLKNFEAKLSLKIETYIESEEY